MRRMSLAASLMLGLAAATMPVMRAHAQFPIGVSITIAPPVLPVYEQPPIPEPGYIWAPGYWAYSDIGYYWVPGTWVLPPAPGLLWTPGYWGYSNGVYGWNAGYWAPQVGFYGGVNYGYGYTGNGYQGGYWRQNHFYYNRNVNNFGGTHITNVYERNVTNAAVSRISYNGGNGIAARPTPQELSYQSQRHVDPTPEQRQQEHLAASNKGLWASQNHGVPAVAATPRPADFTAHGVVAAHNQPVNVQAPPQHAANVMAPQHAANVMAPQHQEQAHPGPAVAPHPENAMSMQHVTAPEQHAAAPVSHPAQTVQHAQPAFHPQAAQHQTAPAYHPAPVAREPAAPAFHPQEARPAPRPAAAARPAEHAQGPEHKPN